MRLQRSHAYGTLCNINFFFCLVFFPQYFLGGVSFSYFLTPPLATIRLYAMPLHRVFLHLHCFVLSYPYYACFLLELAFECLMHHASKFNPYPVQSLCIHWLHIVNPIFCLCTIEREIWVSSFFQNVMHAHVPLTM